MKNITKIAVAVAFVAIFTVFVGHTKAATYDLGTSTLKVGSTGMYVTNLQTALNANGATLTADGHFGPMTKAAAMAYQASHGLTADGLVGAKTKAALNGGSTPAAGCPAGYTCTPAGGTPPVTPAGGTPPVLTGTAGNIDTDTVIGGFSGEQVGAGDTGHQVLGVQYKASAGGSNVSLTAMTLQFTQDPASSCTTTGSGYMNKYFAGVAVWQGSTKVGSANAGDFGQNTSSSYCNYIYSKTVNLSGANIVAGQTSNFYVSVDALPVIDSNNLGASTVNKWEVAITSIRFSDGTGAQLTYTPSTSTTGLVNSSVTNYFNFVSTANANNIKLTVSTDPANQNAHVVPVSLTSQTNNVELLKFKLAAQGQKIHIDKLATQLTSSSVGLGSITSNVHLLMGSTELNSQLVTSTSSTTTTTFNNLNLDIAAGTSPTFSITADINGLTGNYVAGETLAASIPTLSSVGIVTATDQNSNNLSGTAQLTGSVSSHNISLYNVGIQVNPGTVTATHTGVSYSGASDTATYKVSFNVTAFGGAVYLASSSILGNTSTSSTTNKVTFVIAKSSAPTTGITTVSGTSTTMTVDSFNGGSGSNIGTDSATGNYLLNDGDTATFTGTLVQTNNNGAGQYRAWLNNVAWGTGTTTAATIYNFNLGSGNNAYTTGYIALQ